MALSLACGGQSGQHFLMGLFHELVGTFKPQDMASTCAVSLGIAALGWAWCLGDAGSQE